MFNNSCPDLEELSYRTRDSCSLSPLRLEQGNWTESEGKGGKLWRFRKLLQATAEW